MNNNDEKVREYLEAEEVPEEINPERIKNMLDEKAPAKKRAGRISVAGRITAAAAACAVIVGGTAGTMKLVNGRNLKKCDNSLTINTDILNDSSETNQTYREMPKKSAPYMSGAKSYKQVYEIMDEAHKKVKRAESGVMTYGAALETAEDSESSAAENFSLNEETNEIMQDSPAAVSPAGQSLESEYDMFEEEPMSDESDDSEKIFDEGENSFTEDIPNDDITSEEISETVEFSAEEKEEFSETHNQEQDVLEADIVKTDGKRIYYVTNAVNDMTKYGGSVPKMNIAAVEKGEFKESKQIDISPDYNVEGDGWQTNVYVQDMYFYNDMLAVIGTADAYRDSYTVYGENYDFENEKYFWENDSKCFVSFYTQDVEPQLIGTYWQDGGYNDVRIAPDGYMYLVSSYTSVSFEEIDTYEDIDSYIPKCGTEELQCIPAEDILLPDPERLDNIYDLSYTVIGSIDLTESGRFSQCDTKALAGYTGELYSSADNIYVTVWGEDTDITRISVGGGSIEPQASATVEGRVKDQFSMSEYNGCFRIATTVDKWKSNGNFITDIFDIETEVEHISDNRVYVLDMDLNTLGSVEGFGRDETIKSVSFRGNMAYVVTYEQTDPLFAIDMSDPANPFITDEFKILGYSSYMEQWDDGHLLGFGADADENGIEKGVKLVMFDNSDPYNLQEIGLYAINGDTDSYVYSIGMWERKSLLIAPEKNLIGVPVSVSDGNNRKTTAKYMFFSYNDSEFVLRGELGETISWDDFYDGSYDFNRAVYIGEYVYMLSGRRFISADIETFTEQDNVYFN